MKTKIPKEVLQFFLENGTIVDIVEGQKKYTFMPFWFEVIDEEKGIVVFHSLENVPEELKEVIMEDRGVIKPIEINKEDVELWFEEQCYEDTAEIALGNFIRSLRLSEKNFKAGKDVYRGLHYLREALVYGVISEEMYYTIYPLIANPDLEYTIVHKKDES